MNTIDIRPVAVPTAKPAAAQTEQPVVEAAAKPAAPPTDTVATAEPWEMNAKVPTSWKVAVLSTGAALGVAAVKVGLAVALAPTLGAVVTTAAAVAGAAVVGYAAVDLGSGLYHWMIDNYPTENTPILGWQAKEFQEHHSDGDAMGKHNLWDALAPPCKALLLPAAALALLAPVGGVVAAAATAGAGAFLLGGSMAQAYHHWSHQANSGPFPRFLQKIGMAIPRETHLMHHSLQYPETNYCIVNGMWNKPLGEMNFWRRAEKVVYDITGREPHSWKNLDIRAQAFGQKAPEHYEPIKPFGPEYFKAHGGH